MGALAATAVRIRHDLHTRILEARARIDELFQLVSEVALYDRPIAERHRIVFYLGHVEAFDWNLLSQRAFGLRSFHSTFDQLFAFGIDPIGGSLPTDAPEDWPTRQEIQRYNKRLREELDQAIEHALMHAETLSYMLHRLPASKKICPPQKVASKAPRVKSRLVEIPAGCSTLGSQHSNLQESDGEFGWDNEFAAHEVTVPQFAIDSHDVTN